MDDEAARTIAVDAFMERVTGGEKRKMQGPTEAGRGEHRRLVFDFWPPHGSGDDPSSVVRGAVDPVAGDAEVLR
ncbi:hypothetical protein [Streptomyces bobili]|uniref:hypothetical protein n=1 Tax=Streptomyces bobili TaxID=67280 RepID=UPI00371088D4